MKSNPLSTIRDAVVLGKATLRTKILLPFVIITALMTLAMMLISIKFLSDSLEKKQAEQIQRQSLFVKRSIEERLRKSIFYTQLASDIKKNVDRLRNRRAKRSVRRIVTQALSQDRTAIYWTLKTLPREKKVLYQDLIEAGFLGLPKVKVVVLGQKILVVAVSSVKYHGRYTPVISEFPLDATLLADIKSQYKSDIVLLNRASQPPQIMVSTAQFLKNVISDEERQKLTTLGSPQSAFDTIDIKLGDRLYKVVGEPLDLNPDLTVAVFVPSENVFEAKQNYIFGIVFIWFFITLLIVVIYSAIIKKITASIDHLSDTMKKVEAGSLTERAHVMAEDEIGELAALFNQMVTSLNESTANMVNEKNRSEAIISNLPEGIIVTNSDDKLILANHRAEEMFQFSMKENYGKFILECINHPGLLDIIKEQHLEKQSSIIREIRIPIEKGKNKTYLLSSSLAKNQEGDSIGVVTILRDVSREKEIEGLRESFLRTVSHELRTPLTSVIGFIDLVFKTPGQTITNQQKDYLTIASNSAVNLKNLINDLLDLSRIEAGKVNLLYTRIGISDVVTGIASSFMPLTKDKSLSVLIEPIPKHWEMDADLEKVRRILINLISNAIKFTPQGSVKISVDQTESHFVFHISDTGIGLLDEERDIIFDKFRQADDSSTRRYEGIGLGLSIVKELVELHHGKIWVESEYQKGSTFSFSLPKKSADMPQEAMVEGAGFEPT